MDESILEQKITNIITIAIKEKFKNLNTEHTELLIKHLTQVCILLQNYMSVDIDSFIKQLNVEPENKYYLPCSNLDIIKRILNNLIYSFDKMGYAEKVNELKELEKQL